VCRSLQYTDFDSIGYISRSGIVFLVVLFLVFLRTSQTNFHNGCSTLIYISSIPVMVYKTHTLTHTHTHSRQHMLFAFLMIAIVTGTRRNLNLSVVLIYMSFTVKDVEHFFMHSLAIFTSFKNCLNFLKEWFMVVLPLLPFSCSPLKSGFCHPFHLYF
jgi:hypothetical protein